MSTHRTPVALAVLCLVGLGCAGARDPVVEPPPASPCLACHPDDGGRIVGFLEGVSLRSRRLLIDRVGIKEVVAFDEGTILLGVDDAGDLVDEVEGRIAVQAEGRDGDLFARRISIPVSEVDDLPEHNFTSAGARRDGEETSSTVSIEAFRWSVGRPPGSLVILDVRSDEEFSRAHVPGALHIPVDELGARKRELPKDRRILIYCARGVRAKMAHVLLKRYGYDARYLDACFRPGPTGEYSIEPK